MIFCRVCEIALPDSTMRCPMCQRNLRLPVHLVTSGVVLVCVLLGGLLWGSARLKNKVDRWAVSSGDVLKAAQSLVATNPAVRNPVSFSGIDQTTVEHWDGGRESYREICRDCRMSQVRIRRAWTSCWMKETRSRPRW